jgi:DNA-binding NarL/FixJ family response regulator
MADVVRVLLADDHLLARMGVRRALEAGGLEVVAEAEDADSAVRAAAEHGPDICVLDVTMPGDGIEAARRIRALGSGTAIVMLTASARPEDLFRAVEAGAVGYLLKDTDPARLPSALRGVLMGEAAIPRPLVASLVEELRRRASSDEPELSAREQEVLAALREGASTKEIALRLGLSAVTVRRHVSRLMAKLGVEDRAALRALDRR